MSLKKLKRLKISHYNIFYFNKEKMFRMRNLISDKNEKRQKYKESIARYNDSYEDYEKIMNLSQEIISNHEINRNNLLKDIMLKIIGNEISSFKHLILDIEKIQKVNKFQNYLIFSKRKLIKLMVKMMPKKAIKFYLANCQ